MKGERPVDNGAGFEKGTGLLEIEPDTWQSRRVPEAWLAAYRRPIVILPNGFSQDLCELADAADFAENRLAAKILDRHGFYPRLPSIQIVIREGGRPEWRRGLGDLIACRCQSCGEVHLGYWLECGADVRRANRIEAGHPAIPFLSAGAVIFYAGKYAGCHGFGDELPWDGSFWARALAG